jgi:hexosaminidase
MARRDYRALLAFLVVASPLLGQAAPSIIPRPESLTVRTGHFALSARTVIATDRATASIGRALAAWLEPATGLAIPVRASEAGSSGAGRIELRRDTTLRRLGAEGYVLDVTPDRVVIRGSELAGVFYGVQTLRQLLPPEVFREARVEGVTWTIPAVRVEDHPRFAWRGSLLDVGRHFMPKEFVKKYIDLLALHKLNTFHWHLTDDQGWRLEIKKYPRLTSVGAWRAQTIIGRPDGDSTTWRFDGIPHGGFYTQDDVREIVAYARDRFVTIVPEIEMPGHASAAIAAYPALGVTADPIDVRTRWEVYTTILNADSSTVSFMQDVLGEVLTLFPGRYINIGGDEAQKTLWRASPRIQERIRELGAKDEAGLQSWFTKQMDSWLTAHGRRLVGWDEILDGGLAPGATVMSWRGTEGGIAAARAGHDVVMTPYAKTYLDYYQSADTVNEPLAIGGFVPIDTVYAYEPVPEGLEPGFAHHVLGSQAQVWTEYIQNPKQVEYMAFPRLAAFAEVVWTARERRDFTDFSARLATHLRRLDALDVAYRPLDGPRWPRPAGAAR